MPTWRERIRLSQPLREITLAHGPGGAATEKALREREQAGYERGRVEGERALGEQLLRQRSEVLELQNGLLNALRQTLPQVTRECEHTLVSLALEVARKIVSDLPISPEMVEAAVREALAQIEDRTDFTVLLHAEDQTLLERVNAPMRLAGVGGEHIRFETSTAVTRGGCLVRTRFGLLDARRETKFDLLQKVLLV